MNVYLSKYILKSTVVELVTLTILVKSMAIIIQSNKYTKLNLCHIIKIFVTLIFLFALSSCSTTQKPSIQSSPRNIETEEQQARTVSHHEEVTTTRIFYEKGMASYYAHSLTGRKTSSGERYNPRLLTAANKTLPLNTLVLVESTKTGQSVIVRINDRGPYSRHRVIDLSEAAAKKIGLYRKGLAKVNIYLLR